MLSLLCIVLLLFSVPYAFSAEGELDEGIFLEEFKNG